MTSLRALQKGIQMSTRFNSKLSQSQQRFMGSGSLGFRLHQRPNHKWHTDFLMTAAWTWLWYNLFMNGNKAFGHYWYPDPSKWTDEELGIPTDSED